MAWPAAFSPTGLPIGVAPAKKLTVPVVTGLPLLVTVAVKVTPAPWREGLAELASWVEVAASALTVTVLAV